MSDFTFLKKAVPAKDDRGLRRVFKLGESEACATDGHRAHVVPMRLDQDRHPEEINRRMETPAKLSEDMLKRALRGPRDPLRVAFDASALSRAAKQADKRLRERGSLLLKHAVRWDKNGFGCFGLVEAETKNKSKPVMVATDAPVFLQPLEADMGDLWLGINPKFVVDACVGAKGQQITVEFGDMVEPIKIVREDGRWAIIMPCRL